MNRKLDIIIHTLQSPNITEGNNQRQENFAFAQLESKEEFDEFQILLQKDSQKQEQFVSQYYICVLNIMYSI